MNIKDLQALTLVGPTREDLILDPLAVLHLDNQLSRICQAMSSWLTIKHSFNK